MIVEDNVDEPMMSIEESSNVDADEPLGAAAALPEASTTSLGFKDISKAKGISKSTVRREINFDNYQEALDTLNPQRHAVRSIMSTNHVMHLQETLKASIVVNDSKRFWLNKYQSVAFGNNDATTSSLSLPPPWTSPPVLDNDDSVE